MTDTATAEFGAATVAVQRLDVRFTSRAVRIVALASAVAAAAAVLGAHLDHGWRAGPLAAMVLALGYLSVVDLAEHRLPNRIVVPLIGCAGLVVLADGLLGSSSLSAALAHMAVGVTAASVLLILRFGMGDVKLVLAIGTVASWLGPEAVSWTAITASVGGAVASIALMVIYRRVRLDFGFGPFLAVGSVAGMLAAGIAG